MQFYSRIFCSNCCCKTILFSNWHVQCTYTCIAGFTVQQNCFFGVVKATTLLMFMTVDNIYEVFMNLTFSCYTCSAVLKSKVFLILVSLLCQCSVPQIHTIFIVIHVVVVIIITLLSSAFNVHWNTMKIVVVLRALKI